MRGGGGGGGEGERRVWLKMFFRLALVMQVETQN